MNVNKKVVKKGLLPYVFLLLVMLGVVYFVSVANQKVNVLTYDEFMTSLEDKEVKEITEMIMLKTKVSLLGYLYLIKL